MIEGVTFDWWHTIAETPWPDWDERIKILRIETIQKALGDQGVVVTKEDLGRAYERHTELLVSNWGRRADLTAEEQVQAFLRFAGVDGYGDGLLLPVEEAFGRALETALPVLYPHLAQTLAQLRREGYRIGLVSNTGRTWGRYLRPIQDELGIGKYFDARVFSDETRTRKPDPRIFRRALERLHLRPEEVVHIGDDVDADVAGAKDLGMRAVWFNAGFWPEVRTDRADAEIRDHKEFPEVLARWRP